MPNKIVLGNLYNLEISAKPSAFVAFIALWLGLGLLGYFALGLTMIESIFGGFVCAILHFLSELLHQLGHAGAAWRTGYPMRGIRYWAHALMNEPTPLAAFAQLEAPVLYMVGGRSPASSLGVFSLLEKVLPNVRVAQFENLGHMGPVTMTRAA